MNGYGPSRHHHDDCEHDYSNPLPFYLNGDSPRARRDDPETSHAAADSNATREDIEAFVLKLFQDFEPMTDGELTEVYFSHPFCPEADIDSPRKRRSDLTSKGDIVADEGVKRPGRSGRLTQVWRIAA